MVIDCDAMRCDAVAPRGHATGLPFTVSEVKPQTCTTTIAQECGDDGKAYRGRCVVVPDGGTSPPPNPLPRSCQRFCLGDSDCALTQRCVAAFAESFQVCLSR